MFQQEHFFIAAVSVRSERCVVQNERISVSGFGAKYPPLDPSDSQSPSLPERLGVLIFPLDPAIFAFSVVCKPQPDSLQIRLH